VSAFRVKGSTLDGLRAAREQVLRHIGNAKIGEQLAGLDAAQAGDLANDLLQLLDAVDDVLSRAKPAD